MEENKKNLLVDHLDKTLQGESLPEAAQLIRQDAEAKEEWEYLQLAVEAMKHEGLYQQVAAVKEQYLAAKKQPRVFRLFRTPLRIAAAILLLIGSVAIYKYFATTAIGLYRDQYAVYELPVSRGEAIADDEERAYWNKDWKGVIAGLEKSPIQNNQQLFLAGMAHLQLDQYNEAIKKFEQVIANDRQTGDHYFHDEAEYYLALGLLANNEPAEALTILKKIKADPQHLYHEKVMAMSALDLKVLEFKSSAK